MPSSFDLILKNGKCFIDGQLKATDIGISNGIIKSISKIEKTSNEKILDANNLTILPGIIDTQVHFREPGSTDVEDLESGKPIILYPNPIVESRLYIKGLNGESRIHLYDATGKHVLNEKLHKSSINLSSLSSGVYVYMIETDNQIFTGKLVVK